MQRHYPQFKRHCSINPTTNMASCNTLSPSPFEKKASSSTPATTSASSSSSSTDTAVPSPPPTPHQYPQNNSNTCSTASAAEAVISSSSASMSSAYTSPSSYFSILPITATSPPTRFDVVSHPAKDTLVIVSNLLSILVEKNDKHYNSARDPITLFHSRAVPRISIEAYLTRIMQYIPFTNEVLLNVLVYLDRIGGLEGMELQQGGMIASSSSTTTTEAIAAQSILVSTPGSTVSSPKDPGIFLSTSSSSINSDNGFPMTLKRVREETTEAMVDVPSKRTRTESYASSTVTDSIPTPVSTPTPAPTQAPSTTATNGFRINSFNVHRLLITCLMVAAKFTSDLFYSNARYAKVGGLSLPELNQLELELLFTTKFELNVKIEELQRVGNALLQFRDCHMARAALLQCQLQQRMQQMQEIQMKQYSIPSPSSPSTYSSAAVSVNNGAHIQAIPRPLQHQQRTQLLSPPEEKHAWAETEVQEMLAPRIDNHPRQY